MPPHTIWTPGSGALHYTHLCPHWQTSQASLRHIVGLLLLQACVPASRGRRSGPNPAWIYEVQRYSCNALLLNATKSTHSITGRKKESAQLIEDQPSHANFTWLILRKSELIRDIRKLRRVRSDSCQAPQWESTVPQVWYAVIGPCSSLWSLRACLVTQSHSEYEAATKLWLSTLNVSTDQAKGRDIQLEKRSS